MLSRTSPPRESLRLPWTVTLAVLIAACAPESAPESAPASKSASADASPAKPDGPADDDATKAGGDPGTKVQRNDATPKDPPLEQGWVRVDLSSLSPKLSGRVVAPWDKAAVFVQHDEADADGLQTDGVGLRLGPAGGGATLRAPALIPPRFASVEAMLAFHKGFEHVSTHAYAENHWAVVQRWRPGECMLHGWHAKAGLTCDVFKAPCDEMEAWVKTCESLVAGPKPNVSVASPASAFEKLEKAPAALAMRVAQGVARNDSSLLLGAAGPEGIAVDGKTYTRETFDDARGDKTVAQFVAPILGTDDVEPGVSIYQWNTDIPAENEATVYFTAGYGDVPVFKLKQTAGTWHLVAFDIVDLGEP